MPLLPPLADGPAQQRTGTAAIPDLDLPCSIPPPRAATRRLAAVGLARLWAAPLLVGAVAYCVAIAGARSLLNDGDTLSHIAIGRWIVAHGALPFMDPFSHTAAGQRWVPHEWLSEVVFALIYGPLGWGGVVAVTGFACAAALALLTRALAAELGPRRGALVALAAFSLLEAHYLARPHVLAWPLLVIWTAGVIAAADRGRAPPLALLPVMILWCNLHGGFVIGLLIAALMATEAVVSAPAAARTRALFGWGRFLVLAGGSALLSLNGVQAVLLPARMMREMPFALSSIAEWRAVDFSHFDPLLLWIGLMIFGSATLGLKLPVSRVLMVLLLLWLALVHRRNAELLGLIAPLLLAAPLAAQLPPPITRRTPMRTGRAMAKWRGTAAAAGAVATIVLILAITSWGLDRAGLAPPRETMPEAALAAARRADLDGPVFNSVRFGGSLLLAGIPSFVDGRADLFGDNFLKRYVAAENGDRDRLFDLLARYHIAWTLLEPSSPAVLLLDRAPGWERVYADHWAVIQRRTTAR